MPSSSPAGQSASQPTSSHGEEETHNPPHGYTAKYTEHQVNEGCDQTNHEPVLKRVFFCFSTCQKSTHERAHTNEEACYYTGSPGANSLIIVVSGAPLAWNARVVA
ncbi:MAG TPA: hypothetical protein VJ785_02545 [Anaerolineales bacterium]|nr:hypothetical protein [Anaerolineales bacterium]